MAENFAFDTFSNIVRHGGLLLYMRLCDILVGKVYAHGIRGGVGFNPHRMLEIVSFSCLLPLLDWDSAKP